MIEAVLLFAALTALFEWLLLNKLQPRTRLRLLGRPGFLTCAAFFINLAIHYGTITGSMTAVVAALASMLVTSLLRRVDGYILRGVYVPGWRKYPLEELCRN